MSFYPQQPAIVGKRLLAFLLWSLFAAIFVFAPVSALKPVTTALG